MGRKKGEDEENIILLKYSQLSELWVWLSGSATHLLCTKPWVQCATLHNSGMVVPTYNLSTW